MTTKSLAILLVTLASGLGLVFALPQQLGYQPVGVRLALPEFLGEWWGAPEEVTQKERDTLGPDTEFARKTFQNGRGDQIHASIVLAGQDMMTGIHRPERCLHAQGWTTGDGAQTQLALPDRGSLAITRLGLGKTLRRPDGSAVGINSICYYWFIGATDLAATHGERVWLDSRDRVLKGYNQRWAMVMIWSEVTKERTRFGRDEREVDALVKDFIRQLAPKIHGDTVRHGA